MHPDAERLRQETDRGSNNTKKNRSIYWKTAERLVIAGCLRCLENEESSDWTNSPPGKKSPDISSPLTARVAAGAFSALRAHGEFHLIADSPDIAFAHKTIYAKTKSVCL